MKVKGWTRFGGSEFGPKYMLAIKIYLILTKKVNIFPGNLSRVYKDLTQFN